MVLPLGPGKFYGSSLPRPRIYTDIKFNDYRVDPPVSVTDPLISWANEAHWSMGGLSFDRHRLQGRIEGNIEKLRSQREGAFKKREKLEHSSPPVPAAPVAVKRKRRMVVDDDEEEEVEEVVHKRKLARKLKEEFDLVATRVSVSPLKDVDEVIVKPSRKKRGVVEEVGVNKGRGIGLGRRLVKVAEDARVVASGKRMSPRLAKSLFN